ncbi:hypothetical protein TNIN_437941 [Trichonephila inaurata madagascariensis]|uniref:Uncharacterized protein n=1 Tax=Trichonephila inaurata madagascariensis TaxID=2747483 RepID=A0A8X6XD02_9ARAC|nr:hypothetical protein TNIN_437941 [Trichonephila inaurata madagascariensis]
MFISKGTTERSTIVTLRWPGQSFLHPGLQSRGVDRESKRQVFRIVLLHHLLLDFVSCFPSCLLRKMSRQSILQGLTPQGPSTPSKKADQPPTREGLKSTNYFLESAYFMTDFDGSFRWRWSMCDLDGVSSKIRNF